MNHTRGPVLTLPPLTLYVHIPWCEKKCPYCDFNSHTLSEALPETQYLQHLLQDLDHDLALVSELPRPISAIFIGGGTPSLLSVQFISDLLDGLQNRLNLKRGLEITLEANPSCAEKSRFSSYASAGINRLSLGIQTFSERQLRKLGRLHTSQQNHRAIAAAQATQFQAINLDLMYGLPDQSVKEALADLSRAMQYQPEHISWYQLTREPNTIFYTYPARHFSDERIEAIVAAGMDCFNQSTYQQYEISAYARKQQKCQHNLNYWRFGDYLGIGCGAHGKITLLNGTVLRTEKSITPYHYLKGTYRKSLKKISPEALPFEFFLNQFRLFEPIQKVHFSRTTGLHPGIVAAPIATAEAEGYLEEHEHHWSLTAKGYAFMNDLLLLFLPDRADLQ